MAKLNDLTSNKVQERKRQVRTYGTKTDLASTVVERGSTHWAEGSNVHIDGLLGVAGTATVSGVLSVTGTFNASGSINLSGSTSVTGPLVITGTTTIGGNTNITGELNVTGPTTLDGILDIGGDTTITGLLAVDGPTTISGTLDIEGATTVAADFEIIAGGLFKSGVTKIEPTGKATFGPFVIDPNSAKLIEAPGGYVISNGADQIGLSSATSSSVNLSNLGATLDYKGTSTVHAGPTKSELKFGTVLVTARAGAIDLTAPAVHLTGTLFMAGGVTEIRKDRLRISELPTISGQTANVYCNPSGVFYRII